MPNKRPPQNNQRPPDNRRHNPPPPPPPPPPNHNHNNSNNNERNRRQGHMQGNRGGRRGCYIATACYGSYNAPEVLVLRKFRDDTLENSWFGRLFINFYYFVSPFFAEKLKNLESLNRFVRTKILDKIVKKISK